VDEERALQAAINIRIQREDFDIAAEIARLRSRDGSVGAVVTFTGICRNEEGRLAALELEHYPGMAEAEIGRIAQEAASRWPLSAITCIHRFGRIEPGDNIVLVMTTSGHRHAAFEAAAFLMDFLKSRAPFWKKEIERDGAGGGWISAREEDDAALARWAEKTRG
jgi:molybdopterin synthase catalytic subunit